MREKKTTMHRQSAIAAAVLLSLSLPAAAQQQQGAGTAKPAAASEELERVVVTGIRASLRKALDVKRQADSIVDAVTAEDVGKFPATNVAEAITVIPGVTIDKAFGQGEKVSIMGTDPALNRTLLNGQSMASVDWFFAEQQGRTFNYSLLAPQLIQKVEVFKSPEAWIDEGSIGGTVNVVTRKPLDLKGFTAMGSASAIYNDRIRKTDPTVAGMVGWRNTSGSFGVLLTAQHSEENIRRDGIEAYGTAIGRDYITGRESNNNSVTTTSTDWANGGVTVPPACQGACKDTLLANPNAITLSSISGHFFEQVRERDTVSLAVQGKPTDKLTLEFNALNVKAKYDNATQSMFAMQGNTWNSLRGMTALTTKGGIIDTASFRNALTVYDVIARRATLKTDSYDLKANWQDANWSASLHGGASKATGGTDRQVYASFLNKANYSVDLNGAYPTLNFSGYQTDPVVDVPPHAAPVKQGSPFTDPAAFRMDGGNPSPWHTNPPNADNWAPGWGGNVVQKPSKDEEKFLQADFKVKLDSFVHQLRFGAKLREHQTGQTMSGVALSSIRGYGDASASQFSPQAMPGNYLDGFSEVSSLKNRFRVDGWQVADYITSQKWLAPWQEKPVTTTFGDPSFAANTWTVKEDVTAAYVQGDFLLDDLRGNFGLRAVQTESAVTGWSFVGCPPGNPKCLAPERYVPSGTKKKYRDLLPNINLVYDLSADVILRGSVAKVMARPNYGDMSDYLWISDSTLSGGGGNPHLKPQQSTNLDFSAEWYLSKNAILAGALFHKRVSDYILQKTAKETHFNQNQQRNAVYDIARPWNAGSATIQGFSLAYQNSFGNGLGVLANYTQANGNAENGSRLPYNSKHQVTFSPFYENDTLSARVTYSMRSKYYTAADRGNFVVTRDHRSLDSSFSYKFGNGISLNLDGMNLLDSEYSSYAEVPYVAATEKLTRGAYRTGRRYMATLRYTY